MRKKSIEQLKELIKGDVLLDEPMFKHTSFRIGGPAEIFCKPKDEEDIKNILIWAKRNKKPVIPVGNGTNLLVSDHGISGVVVQVSNSMNGMMFDGESVIVKSGSTIRELINSAMAKGLGGVEFAWGIPGTVGGSIVMNAGTNSHFLSKFVKYVNVVDFSGKQYRLNHDDLKFDYRYSILQDEPLILIDALFNLESMEVSKIKRAIEEASEKRKNRQPSEYPCAGSIFKNPPTTYAGKVLEESNCKGMRVGDAMVSDLHANFIINLGHATANDVLTLIRKAQERVYREKDLILELEIKLLGNFNTDLLLKRK